MSDFKLRAINESFIQFECDRGLAQELSDYFTFYAANYKFHPKFKSRVWDGKIRLCNLKNNTIYRGLLSYIKVFCHERNYTLSLDDSLELTESFSIQEAGEFIESLNLPKPKIEVRDYQINAFVHSIRNKRVLLLSPTGSGKSLIIYFIIKYLQQTKRKGLIVVPTTALCHQMFNDFNDYGYDSDENCHIIYSGKDKTANKFLYISTWQSLYNLDAEYFEQFEFVIVDESHLAKANSLTTILNNCINADYRIGTTGTLDNINVHKLMIEALTGPVYKATTTSELIEQKYLADFEIKCLILKHTNENCIASKKWDHKAELDFVISNPERNKFITNLTLSLKGNTLVLYQFVEKHGKVLFDMIKEKAGKRQVFFVFGGTDVEIRESVRTITEKETNAIIVASYGTFSTGTNIRNLHNVIFASPSKSKVRNLQSIGRVLRLHDSKETAVLFDITDDLRTGKTPNYGLKHFVERTKIYDEQKFNYKFYNIQLKNPNNES